MASSPPNPRPDSRLRGLADRLIHHPTTELGLVVVIIAAVVSLLAEAAFLPGTPVRVALEWLSRALTWLFVLELLIRFWVAPSPRRFFVRYWLDILAVLPLARPLRLLRVLLLLRLFRAGLFLNRRLNEYTGILRGSLQEMTIVATLTSTVVLVGAFTIHTVQGSIGFDDPHLAGTMEGSLWFSVYTLVGGEPIGGLPKTELGRAVTLALMVGGLTIFGIFVGAVSASMTAALQSRIGRNTMELDEISDHIVVCGWNPAGPMMLRELFGRDQKLRPVVVVTEQAERPPGLDGPGIRGELLYHYGGDYTRVEVLEAVGIRRAGEALLLTDTCSPRSDTDRDARTVLAALTIERLAPGIFCCAELVNGEHAAVLKMAKVEEVVVRDWYAGKIMGAMGRNRGLASVLDDILSSEEGNAFYKLKVGTAQAGKTIGELHQLLKVQHEAILVSWEQPAAPSRGEKAVRVNPPQGAQVSEGDILVVIGPRPVLW